MHPLNNKITRSNLFWLHIRINFSSRVSGGMSSWNFFIASSSFSSGPSSCSTACSSTSTVSTSKGFFSRAFRIIYTRQWWLPEYLCLYLGGSLSWYPSMVRTYSLVWLQQRNTASNKKVLHHTYLEGLATEGVFHGSLLSRSNGKQEVDC